MNKAIVVGQSGMYTSVGTHPYCHPSPSCKKDPHSLPFASHIIPHLVFCLRVFVACLHEWDQASFSAAAVELRFEPIPSAFESSCVRLKCRSMGDRSVTILVSRNESYI